ncbi:TrpB-like pyridoxal phosphate-dependent enzyme [Archangium sp.]|uniref:TrpB-like pyridoxal phosphate-dependent enzyme n=1 Tax=Archangium sp. TaxID=1872627 RepID=UPI002D287C66|nr:TrpB-like pyridoxal phosphate-dependent enzyme [Archangium sp.]HYO59309.1 TrpB-like pyridoxal phosphate-dependent enzyme [Archangium sp.]
MTTKYLLSDERIPRHWYNIIPDLPTAPAPVLHPGTHQPVKPEDLAPLFPLALIEQEMSLQREVPIPEEVRAALARWRPSPLFRAHALEKALGTRSHIYYKYEGVSPAGSHKPNTAVAQAYYNAKAGVRRLATETGAGQWGSSIAFAGQLFGLAVTVYMVKVSYEQKPYRRSLMRTWGAEVFASPSEQTNTGRGILAKDPGSNGSLGIAISEAVEDAATHEDTKYALGSVLNHVCMHQTVIGLEAQEQMKLAGEYPDVVIGCHGGGSNFAGIAFPFARDKMHGKPVRLLAAEPTSCPTLTRGVYAFDYGDTAKMSPVVKMHTLGHDFMPPGIHAGGLRYHGASPLVSQLLHAGLMEAVAFPQRACFEAAVLFARTEGILPAPESSHAIKAALEEARKADEEGRERVILFNLSGHGHFDLGAYDQYLAGRLEDYEYPREAIERSMAGLPKVDIA